MTSHRWPARTQSLCPDRDTSHLGQQTSSFTDPRQRASVPVEVIHSQQRQNSRRSLPNGSINTEHWHVRAVDREVILLAGRTVVQLPRSSTTRGFSERDWTR